ncbi:MAG: CocE/NonD family hydrolase [Vicinamibacteria bacterium]
MRQGSPIGWDVVVLRDVPVPMRDGARLACDVYLPALGGTPAPGRFPALVERTPYDKRRPALWQSGHYFARRGYVAVMQDVRGRHRSEGDWFFLGPHEGPDGYDTLAWVTAQPWCDGGVGTFGLSYSTATQQALAVTRPPGLRAQFLSDGGFDYFHRTLRHSGAFELGVALPHAIRMGREVAQGAALAALDEASRDLRPLLAELPLRKGASVLRHAPREERWLLELQNRGERDAFWRQPTLSMRDHVGEYPDLAAVCQSSWYGHHVWATTQKWRALRERGAAPKKLLIGPWLHGYEEYGRSFAGEADFGAESLLLLDDLRLRFFDQALKRLHTGIFDEPPVRIFVMGGGDGRRTIDGRIAHGGRWRDETDWPLVRARPQRLFLHPAPPGGAAVPSAGLRPRPAGTLRAEAPADGVSPSRYAFDPRDPAPTIGGPVQNPFFPRLIQGGAFDQRSRRELWVCRDERPLAERPDVLVFETEPLAGAVEVTGPIEVVLHVASSAADTDFTAKLVDVYPPSGDWPAGFAMNLTDGIQRMRYRDGYERATPMAPGEVCRIVLELQATSNLFAAGHRIRLDVSSSSFPRFDVNPNTGGPFGEAATPVVAQQALFHDALRASHVVLPVVPAD